jgi:hypothetical protein
VLILQWAKETLQDQHANETEAAARLQEQFCELLARLNELQAEKNMMELRGQELQGQLKSCLGDLQKEMEAQVHELQEHLTLRLQELQEQMKSKDERARKLEEQCMAECQGLLEESDELRRKLTQAESDLEAKNQELRHHLDATASEAKLGCSHIASMLRSVDLLDDSVEDLLEQQQLSSRSKQTAEDSKAECRQQQHVAEEHCQLLSRELQATQEKLDAMVDYVNALQAALDQLKRSAFSELHLLEAVQARVAMNTRGVGPETQSVLQLAEDMKDIAVQLTADALQAAVDVERRLRADAEALLSMLDAERELTGRQQQELHVLNRCSRCVERGMLRA